MRILCIFLLGNEWYSTKETNTLFSLVAFHFVSQNIVLRHTNDTQLRKRSGWQSAVLGVAFFCLFYNHHQKKKRDNGSERKTVNLCHHQPFFCVCTQRIVLPKQTFVQVFIIRLFLLLKCLAFVNVAETKSWYCVKATFDISFQRSAKKRDISTFWSAQKSKSVKQCKYIFCYDEFWHFWNQWIKIFLQTRSSTQGITFWKAKRKRFWKYILFKSSCIYIIELRQHIPGFRQPFSSRCTCSQNFLWVFQWFFWHLWEQLTTLINLQKDFC